MRRHFGEGFFMLKFVHVGYLVRSADGIINELPKTPPWPELAGVGLILFGCVAVLSQWGQTRNGGKTIASGGLNKEWYHYQGQVICLPASVCFYFLDLMN